jgi:flavodoxin
MNTIIVLYSCHHRNTEKIASRIAEILDARIAQPQQAGLQEIHDHDLVGFGSGIYNGTHHKKLLELADNLPQTDGKKVFLFSTDGMPRGLVKNKATLMNKMYKDHTALRQRLQSKGYVVFGEFNCAGFDTYGFWKLFGGLNKGRPDAQDLAQAAEFADRKSVV